MSNVVKTNRTSIITKASIDRKAVNTKIRGLGVDTSKFAFGEIPTPAPNGVITQFTTPDAFVSKSLTVYRDKMALQPNVDFTETTPGSGIFDVVLAPDSDEVIWCNYIKP